MADSTWISSVAMGPHQNGSFTGPIWGFVYRSGAGTRVYRVYQLVVTSAPFVPGGSLTSTAVRMKLTANTANGSADVGNGSNPTWSSAVAFDSANTALQDSPNVGFQHNTSGGSPTGLTELSVIKTLLLHFDDDLTTATSQIAWWTQPPTNLVFDATMDTVQPLVLRVGEALVWNQLTSTAVLGTSLANHSRVVFTDKAA